MDFEKIEKTLHYRKEHEEEVPWDLVLKIVFKTKRKMKSKNLIEFKTSRYYVLAKLENKVLKIINAKKLEGI